MSAANNAYLYRKKYNSDPLRSTQHAVFSTNTMRAFHRRSDRRVKTPEEWLGQLSEKPEEPVFRTFRVVVYSRPNKCGRASALVDPNSPEAVAALVWQIVQASGMGSKRVTLKLDGKSITKRSHLAKLRTARPYQLEIKHGGPANADCVEVPSKKPECVDTQVNKATSSTPTSAGSGKTLAEMFSVNDSAGTGPEKTVMAALTRAISQRFGASMQSTATAAGLSDGKLLNAYHTANMTAHSIATDPSTYHEALCACGMSPAEAAKVTPDAFWGELAELDATEAADNIAKSIADNVASMPNEAHGADAKTLYATKAAGAPIFRGWLYELGRLFGVNRGSGRWRYRMSPAYSMYHYTPNAYRFPAMYRRGRRGRRGQRNWLMVQPFRMAVADSAEEAGATAAEANAELAARQGHYSARQSELARILSSTYDAQSNASVAQDDTDVCVSVATQDAAASAVSVTVSNPVYDHRVTQTTSAQADVTVSIQQNAAVTSVTMSNPVYDHRVTQTTSAQADVTVSVQQDAAAAVSVTLSEPMAAASEDSVGAVMFSTPDMTAATDSVLSASVITRVTGSTGHTDTNELSKMLINASQGDMDDTCVLVLPGVAADQTYSRIVAGLNGMDATTRANSIKSMADHYSVPATGHAERINALLSGTAADSSMMLCTRSPGTQWKLSRTNEGRLMLSNRDGVSAFATAHAHPTNANVLVLSAPIYHKRQ